jgi:CDP-diacylglycerol--serine O-phosphatidyltransferase
MDDPNKPAFAAKFFTGVPAPAGAIAVLLPIYLAFLGVPHPPAVLTAFYTLLIAILMVSRLPVFSGKMVGMRVPPELVLPVFVAVVFFIALLISYPWVVLSFCSIGFLLSLPIGWKSYRDLDLKAAVEQTFPAEPSSTDAASPVAPPPEAKSPTIPIRPRKPDNRSPRPN